MILIQEVHGYDNFELVEFVWSKTFQIFLFATNGIITNKCNPINSQTKNEYPKK